MSHIQKRQKFLTMSSFNWKDCGATTDPGHLEKLTLTPDPLKLPGNLTIGFDATLGIDLSSPIMVDLTVQKKVIVWVTLPCVHSVGSCSYTDICSLVEKVKCPKEFQDHGIPCKCPVSHKNYSLPPSTFYVDDSSLPAFLADGEYRVTGKMSQNQKSVGCVHVEFSVTR